MQELQEAILRPKVRKAAGRYEITFGHGVKFLADRIRVHQDGRSTCRLRVQVVGLAGVKELYTGQFNFGGPRARQELAKHLEAVHPDPDPNLWGKVVEIFCRELLRHEDEGEPCVRLEMGEIQEPDYIAFPLAVARNTVVWYGPGGSGKSYLAMYLAILVQNGLTEVWPGVCKSPVIYLDWETDKETAERRARLIAWPLVDRFEKELEMPYYRRCVLPLADDISDIAAAAADVGAKLIVVDSAGPACGGDIEAAESALRFFSGLRQILAETGAGAVVLSHVTKSERRAEGSARLPIGSIYFENIPRSTWEFQKLSWQAGEMIVGVYNRKCNDAALHAPVGFRIEFAPEGITFTRESVEDVGDETKTKQEMVLEVLQDGPKTVGVVADHLGVSKSHACHILRVLEQRGLVARVMRGTWGLIRRPARESGPQVEEF